MRTRPYRLLISARDPGAAHSIEPVIRTAQTDDRFVVTVFADGMASDIFSAGGIEFLPGNVSIAPKDDLTARTGLAAAGEAIIEQVSPDAVLAGSSGPDAGLDEALLCAAAAKPATTFLLQDYWGDINPAVRDQINLCFVIDQRAADLTGRLHNTPCCISGPPRYADFAGMKIARMREGARERLRATPMQTVAGIFGQPFLPRDAWVRSCMSFIETLNQIEPNAITFYKPHPKEDPAGTQIILDRAAEHGKKVERADEEDTLGLLASCDVAASGFSNCGYDLAWLTRYAPAPLGVMIFLMTEFTIRDSWQEFTGLKSNPVADQGLALVADDEAGLNTAITTALQPEFRVEAQKRARHILPDAADSSTIILDSIYAMATQNTEFAGGTVA